MLKEIKITDIEGIRIAQTENKLTVGDKDVRPDYNMGYEAAAVLSERFQE